MSISGSAENKTGNGFADAESRTGRHVVCGRRAVGTDRPTATATPPTDSATRAGAAGPAGAGDERSLRRRTPRQDATTRQNEAGRARRPAPIDTCLPRHHEGKLQVMATLLWILAVVLVVSGIVALLRSQVLWGIVLIIVGLLVGPGGVSIFT
jgi:hypothetical protein